MVSIEGHAANRQSRSNDKRAEAKHNMLSRVLPKISDLSVVSTEMLFEVLSMGAKLSSADVEKYLSRPTSDRERLVPVLYRDRWEEDAEFRHTWPDDRSELTSALQKWASDQFIKRTTSRIGARPLGSKQSSDRLSTHSTPRVVEIGQTWLPDNTELGKALERWAVGRFTERSATQVDSSPPGSEQSDDRLNNQSAPDGEKHGDKDNGGVIAPQEWVASCVGIPLPKRSPDGFEQPTASLRPEPPAAVQLTGDGTLSMVVPEAVIGAVKESFARMDSEMAPGPGRVTDRDLQQWNKVVCCIMVTADVWKVGGARSRAPKEVEMIVSVKPQQDSRARGGYRLCANDVATFDSPRTNLAEMTFIHTNVTDVLQGRGSTC